MPYDGSGNFTRSYDWTNDRDNGIKILATRMDGEFDNFATGMNAVFLRNGVVAMGGNFNLGANSIYGIAAGSAGTPAIRFSDSATSGFYLGSGDKPSVSVLGNKIGEFSSTGFGVTGTLDATTINNAAGVALQFGASTKLATVTGGVNVTGTLGVSTVNAAAGVALQFNGSTKLATVTGGVTITGIMTSTSAAIAAVWTFNSSGISGGAGFTHQRTGTPSEGAQIAGFQSDNGSSFEAVAIHATHGNGANAAARALLVQKNSSTNRSINAAGTVNASGADYAEYMRKRDDCGPIAKGQVCGVDANGELTDNWELAHSFVVKSTDPAYVGGDSWGADLDEDELEAVRQQYDRIAFSGQVPVNYPYAKPGDYIVPIEGPNSRIDIVGVAASDMTPWHYQNRIGKVWKILPDGRAWIDVQHG